MRSNVELALIAAGLLSACAGPSRADIAEKNEELKRLQSAHAVHMPKEVDSCVGVTLRLADPNAPAEMLVEREKFAKKASEDEVKAALAASGAEKCKDAYLEAVARGEASAEAMVISMSYGIDPAGRVCSVVERERMEAIDPAGADLIEASAACLVKALFAAQFPAGRVEDRERIVLPYKLVADPNSAPK